MPLNDPNGLINNFMNKVNQFKQQKTARLQGYTEQSEQKYQSNTTQQPSFNNGSSLQNLNNSFVTQPQEQQQDYYSTGMGQEIQKQQNDFALQKLSQNMSKSGMNQIKYFEDSPSTKTKTDVLKSLRNLNSQESNTSLLQSNSQALSQNSGNSIIESGKQYIGTPYVWGGNDLKKGVDCSGLTQQLFKQQGINLPRVAADQAKGGKDVNIKDLQAGDLVFFNTVSDNNEPIDHVGIYSGNGKFLNAQSNGVMFDDLNSDYWKKLFVKAKRY